VDEKYTMQLFLVPRTALSYLDLDQTNLHHTTHCPKALWSSEKEKEERSANDACVLYGSNYLGLKGMSPILGKLSQQPIVPH
jgi:hypothetical protein